MVGVKTIILTLDGKTEEALKDLINPVSYTHLTLPTN